MVKDGTCSQIMQFNNSSQLARKVQELTVLYEISQVLVSTTDLRKSLNRILNVLHQLMGMERGTIFLLAPGSQEIYIEAAKCLNAGLRLFVYIVKGDSGVLKDTPLSLMSWQRLKAGSLMIRN